MTKAKTGKAKDLEALREFVRGYLNQDFREAYGSAAGAAAAFCEDASARESRDVAAQWQSFVDSVSGSTAERINQRLTTELGSGWSVETAKDLEDVSRVLGKYLKK